MTLFWILLMIFISLNVLIVYGSLIVAIRQEENEQLLREGKKHEENFEEIVNIGVEYMVQEMR